MKKIIAVFSLVAFLAVGAFALNSISSDLISLDSKVDKVLVDKDPVKDGDKKDKKSSKTKTTAKDSNSKSGDCSGYTKESCSDKKTDCSKAAKTSCCSGSKPDKK